MSPRSADRSVDCCGGAVEWLPSEVHEESTALEPQHLSELVAELKAAWSILCSSADKDKVVQANCALCGLVAPIRAMCAAAPPVAMSAISDLVAVLAEAATLPSMTVPLFTRARLVGLLERVLARFGRLNLPELELGWEALYDAVFNVVLRSNTAFLDSDSNRQESEKGPYGTMLEVSLRHGLRSVVPALRKYLRRGSAEEIWGRCQRLLEVRRTVVET